MKKILITLSIIVICLYLGRWLLLASIENKLKYISEYYQKSDSVNILIANHKGDGSERLPQNLSKEIQNDVNKLISYLKVYCGHQSRIYLHVMKDDASSTVHIKVNTRKMWQESLFSYHQSDWLYSTNDQEVLEKIKTPNYARHYGNIMKVNTN